MTTFNCRVSGLFFSRIISRVFKKKTAQVDANHVNYDTVSELVLVDLCLCHINLNSMKTVNFPSVVQISAYVELPSYGKTKVLNTIFFHVTLNTLVYDLSGTIHVKIRTFTIYRQIKTIESHQDMIVVFISFQCFNLDHRTALRKKRDSLYNNQICPLQ